MTHAELTNNCKRNPAVHIKKEENGDLCIGQFDIFDKNLYRVNIYACVACSDPDIDCREQQFEILKTGNASDSIHICLQTHLCLTALDLGPLDEYRIPLSKELKANFNKEAMYLNLNGYNQSDTSQHWLLNSTTHQLSNVQYPKRCITISYPSFWPVLLECEGYGLKLDYSKLDYSSTHQRFYLEPALDEKGEQLCID